MTQRQNIEGNALVAADRTDESPGGGELSVAAIFTDPGRSEKIY
jgi:hypothetical protein